MTPTGRYATPALAALCCAALIACSGAPSRPNVIVVVVDTLRADRVGTYGAARPTPFLDAFAADAVVWERAYAPSSWTVPSVASLFLAQMPFEHRIAVVNAVLPEDVTTLAEVLHDAGYRTAAVSANVEITADAGFAQGFDAFHTVFRPPKDDASAVTRAALEAVDDRGDRDRPLFLYLQYMEPHAPYRRHDGVTSGGPPDGVDDRALADRVNAGAFALRDGAPLPEAWQLTPAERTRLAALYDGEVAHVDAALATLFTELDRRGVLGNALVVVTADHGEELGEHGMYSHGNTLFEETIRVPLIMRLPGAPGARRIREPVTIAGLAPAILGAVGVAPPASFHVAALPLDGTPGGGVAIAEVLKESPTYLRLHRRAVVGTAGKLLVMNDGREAFVDLTGDPREERLLETAPFAPALRQALATAPDAGGGAEPRAGAALDAAARERLRALGYVD